MEREFLTLLSSKLTEQSQLFQKKAREEENSLTSSAYNMQALSIMLMQTALVETFNELNGGSYERKSN